MIDSTTKYANQPVHLAKYEAFAANARRLGLTAIEASIRLALPRIQNNVFWRQTRYYELENYLRSLLESLKIRVE